MLQKLQLFVKGNMQLPIQVCREKPRPCFWLEAGFLSSFHRGGLLYSTMALAGWGGSGYDCISMSLRNHHWELVPAFDMTV